MMPSMRDRIPHLAVVARSLRRQGVPIALGPLVLGSLVLVSGCWLLVPSGPSTPTTAPEPAPASVPVGDAGPPEIPALILMDETGAEHAGTPIGCSTWSRPGGEGGGDGCGLRWVSPPEDQTFRVRAGSELVVRPEEDAGGGLGAEMLSWRIVAATQRAVDKMPPEGDNEPDTLELTAGDAAQGVAGVPFEAPDPGHWQIAVEYEARSPGLTWSTRAFFRIVSVAP